jgi:hypothetical protein
MAYLPILCSVLLSAVAWHNNLDLGIQGNWMCNPDKYDEDSSDYKDTGSVRETTDSHPRTMEQLEWIIPASCIDCNGQTLMQKCCGEIEGTIPGELHWTTGVWEVLQLFGGKRARELLYNINLKSLHPMPVWTSADSHKLLSCVEGATGIVAFAILGPRFRSSPTALLTGINSMFLSGVVYGDLISESLDIPVDSDDHFHAADFDQATAGAFIVRETKGERGIYDIIPRGLELSEIIEDIKKHNKTSTEENELLNFVMTIPKHNDPEINGQIGDFLIVGNLSGMSLLEKKSGHINLPYSVNPELFPNGTSQRATLYRMIKKMTSDQVATLIKLAGLQERIGYFIRSEVIIKFMHMYIGHSRGIGENEGITNRNAVTVTYHGRQTDYVCINCVYTLYRNK